MTSLFIFLKLFMKILFLDQNTAMRSSVINTIRHKYDVKSLPIDVPVNVADAISKVKSNVYELIISEYYPSGNLTGYDFLERIRLERLTSWKTTFMILTSQEPATKDIEKIMWAWELNIDAYVYKPFTTEYLSNKVIWLLEKKEQLMAIYNLMYIEKYTEAIQLCIQKKIKIFSQNKDSPPKEYLSDIVHLELVCYLKLKDYEWIIKLYRQALKYPWSTITQKWWFAYFYAKSLYQLWEYAEAEKISQMIKEKFPKYVKNYELLADIFHAQKKDEESLALLKVARDISPLNIERQLTLWKQALLSWDLQTAGEANKFVIDKWANSCLYTMDTHANMAHVYGELWQFEEALTILNQWVSEFAKTDPIGSKFTCAVMESQIYAKKWDTQQAKSAFDYALEVYQSQGENNNEAFQVSDEIKIYFSAECLENGHEEIAQSLIWEVVDAGTHRQDLLEKHLKKTIRTPEKAEKIWKMIENPKEEILEVSSIQPEEVESVDLPELLTMEDGFLKMTQEFDQLSSRVSSIYDKIAGDDADELTQNFKNAMDQIDGWNFHEAAQLLESIIDGPLDHNKTTYQNAIESVKSWDWKKAISILKLENIKNQDNPRTYFDLAQLSFFYLEKNLESVAHDDYTYEKMFFQAQSYLERWLSLLTLENEWQYKSLIGIIKLVMNKIEKKRADLLTK